MDTHIVGLLELQVRGEDERKAFRLSTYIEQRGLYSAGSGLHKLTSRLLVDKPYHVVPK